MVYTKRGVKYRFQFLGIPPKGEQFIKDCTVYDNMFPISRDPPEGGTSSRESIAPIEEYTVSNF